jgi:hypothetical protein
MCGSASKRASFGKHKSCKCRKISNRHASQSTGNEKTMERREISGVKFEKRNSHPQIISEFALRSGLRVDLQTKVL